MGWLSKLLGLEAKKRPAPELRNIAEVAADNGDIVDGWKFAATMNASTPLEWLLRHGERAAAPSDVPAHYGIWVPVAKSLRDLGFEIDDLPAGTIASQVGQIQEDGGDFLPFLIEHRRIVEAPDNGINSLRLEALKERYPQFAEALEPRRKRKTTRKG